MENHPRSLIRAVAPDLIVLAVLAIAETYFANIQKPFERGFFCDDQTLRYPLLKQSVPSVVLNTVGIGSCLIVILVVELRRKKNINTVFTIGNYSVQQWQYSIYHMLALFCFGALCNQLLTEIGKKTIGRLRPHFWETCNPNVPVNCQGLDVQSYITDYVCKSTDARALNDIRVSFPSGHSSFSFYCAVFSVLYLQARWKTSCSLLWKPIIQFLFLSAAWFTSLSRVMNNKHHWSDVLAGITLGCFVSIVNVVYIMKLFSRPEVITKKAINDDQNGGESSTINLQKSSHMQL